MNLLLYSYGAYLITFNRYLNLFIHQLQSVNFRINIITIIAFCLPALPARSLTQHGGYALEYALETL